MTEEQLETLYPQLRIERIVNDLADGKFDISDEELERRHPELKRQREEVEAIGKLLEDARAGKFDRPWYKRVNPEWLGFMLWMIFCVGVGLLASGRN